MRRSFGMGARELALASRAALVAPVTDEAELWLATPGERAVVLGAFQRGTERGAFVRRGSGGPAVGIGEGTVWMALLLPRVSALVSCDEARIVNRYVRPLLRALTRSGAQAHFFGRDWVSVKHRPAAWIGFAHERASGRAVVEAFVADATPFDVDLRAAYLGKEPGTVETIVGARVGAERLVSAIMEAHAASYGRAIIERGEVPVYGEEGGADSRSAAEPPWAATVQEAIGPIGAGVDGRGRFRVGGDLLVSTDALAALEERLERASDAEVAGAVDATLGAAGVALDGVRTLTSVRDVILAARRAQNRA